MNNKNIDITEPKEESHQHWIRNPRTTAAIMGGILSVNLFQGAPIYLYLVSCICFIGLSAVFTNEIIKEIKSGRTLE